MLKVEGMPQEEKFREYFNANGPTKYISTRRRCAETRSSCACVIQDTAGGTNVESAELRIVFEGVQCWIIHPSKLASDLHRKSKLRPNAVADRLLIAPPVATRGDVTSKRKRRKVS